jgi:hypothetical protein
MAEVQRLPVPVIVQPSGSAPAAGLYEEVTTLGAPSGLRMLAWKDERLPHSPRGYWWRLVPAESALEPSGLGAP